MRASPPRSIILSASLVLITMAAGLVVRFAPLGLPSPITKYGGSTLWALMIYWIVSTLKPAWNVALAAAMTATLTTAIEFAKLIHTPALDAFRFTWLGILLLGRLFSLWDIVAYWSAIAFGACIDHRLRPTFSRPIP